MTKRRFTPAYPAELRERGVRLFQENRADYSSDSAAYRAIAPKLGCSPDGSVALIFFNRYAAGMFRISSSAKQLIDKFDLAADTSLLAMDVSAFNGSDGFGAAEGRLGLSQ